MQGNTSAGTDTQSLLRTSADMGVVVFGRPPSGLTMASTFSKATTEARVMHKAVKKMRKNRPKKVRDQKLMALKCWSEELAVTTELDVVVAISQWTR